MIARLWRTGLARRRRRCCCWWGHKIQTTIYSTWTLQGGQSIHLCVPKSTHVVVGWSCFFFFYSIIIHFIFISIKPKAILCLTLLPLVTGRRTRRKKEDTRLIELRIRNIINFIIINLRQEEEELVQTNLSWCIYLPCYRDTF